MNFIWNLGFLVALTMILQILTGILLGLHYTPHINSAYTTIMHILREVYFGWSFRSLHSSGASFLFFLLFFQSVINAGCFYLQEVSVSAGVYLSFVGAFPFLAPTITAGFNPA